MNLRKRLLWGLAAAALAGGCETHQISPPPVTVQQYEQSLGGGSTRYPPRTVVLHNLQRVLDSSLADAERIESLKLVNRLGGGDPAISSQLAGLLGDPNTPDTLGQAILNTLLERGSPAVATHVAQILPRLEPGSPLKAKMLAWLARHRSPDVLGELVRLWAKEKSPTSLQEPRYRQAVENISGKSWDEALLAAINDEAFPHRDSAMSILAGRIKQDVLRRRIAALQPHSDTVAAIQSFLTSFDFFSAAPEDVRRCDWLYRNRRRQIPDASRLYASWREVYGYRFRVWDFPLLSRLGRDPLRKNVRRPRLILQLANSFIRRPHVPRAIARPVGLYDFSDRFSKHVESLSMADLWRLLLLDELLRRPRVQRALRLMAEGDRSDTRNAWGGLIFYENGRADAKLYPAAGGGGDETYVMSSRARADLPDALCVFYGHFQKQRNAGRAGPSSQEVRAAAAGRYAGLVLTYISADTFCAHYFCPEGIVISLGEFPFG
ncbi:MAG: hypothetical protein J7M21_04970 [Planctomycetes bacterium]|nr:hypothetical protein [Planctomycetota bacterium]